MQPSLICHRDSSLVVPCRIYAHENIFVYVKAIISIPESISAARFTYHPVEEIVKLNCITCLSFIDDVIQEMKPA